MGDASVAQVTLQRSGQLCSFSLPPDFAATG
jgi:hypothetical protein